MTDPHIKAVGIIGSGVIGAGWAARLLVRGIDVIATDPAEGAEDRMRGMIETAWPAMSKLLPAAPSKPGTLSFTRSLEEVAANTGFIQEAAPEREDLKIGLFSKVDAIADPDVIIASSSSGFLPSRLQSECKRHPERVVIGHPFNPVYLLPLVELVPGDKTTVAAMNRAQAYYERIGMHVLRLQKEIEGYICDRLQEALWREALHILNKGVATTAQIDDSIIYSAGLRWAFMGSFLTYHLAGGPGGMRHFMAQFDPTMDLPWTDLKYPVWNDTLNSRLIEGCEEQAAGRSVRELEAIRNDVLVDLMRVLQQHKIGAGSILAHEEATTYRARGQKPWTKGDSIDAPLKLYETTVSPQWVDYNNHMSEAYYLTAFGDATDALFRFIGDDEDYRASGLSFYTVETHINYVKEVAGGEPLTFTTQLLGFDRKRLHFFHQMFHARTGDLLCTTEQMLLHVDTHAQKAAPMRQEIFDTLNAIWAVHKDLPKPNNVGRQMNVPEPVE
ncbi:carnitine 3-dehydrogenase [Rhodoligotrophos appendicifer]|uniref:3-hydroxyacyl-CoA dehydrogenase NAD-binding domain-containing protein n=1 Tax=Rhodoligotrophos appendicifer TaxID=987056 RepID=UPI0011856E85|nr:3-hydroxyacyl-CoA dehydrogenase NAD-binding domain-containing protein [Rhodoligotrophos appendicifer]